MGKKKQRRMQKRPSLKQKVKAQNPNMQINEVDDGEKMSAIILRFIDPFMSHVTNKASFEKLIVVATLVWNLSLLPSEKQQEELIALRSQLSAEGGWRPEMDIVVAMMLKRKRQLFDDIKRFVIDYKITERGDQYHLSVVSTPMDKEE